jgi:transaldolase/glucose-6-phosphate isomerase
MSEDAIGKLHALGQSLWYDNIQRRLLENGELAGLIASGQVRGVTSNPSIFHNAIAKSHDYDAALTPMAWSGWTAEQIFYQLAVEDIQAAADLFLPLYRQTQGGDGYVSLEVSPYLAHDTENTVAEAKRLWQAVGRPNLMIKIPATPEGIPAITQTISAGINVNVTLIFSLARYAQVMDAYLRGLEKRAAVGQAIDTIASVASFFVSRVDTKVDASLQEIIKREGQDAAQAAGLMGKAAIANARLAYAQFHQVVNSQRFHVLQARGARLQRPLWASTSTKNPAYSDVLYVDELIGADTVNTIPPQTLEAFRDHGQAKVTLDGNADEAQQIVDKLESLGISMDQVTQQLEDEGVKAFADAFTALLKTLEERRVAAQTGLGPLKTAVASRVDRLAREDFPRRLFAGEPDLWTSDSKGQSEVRIRMGWLGLPETSQSLVGEVSRFAQECRAAGFTHALLLGMGGTSLATETMRKVFEADGERLEGLDLAILDSTDPAQVRSAARRSPVKRTLYIVSSKSGSTTELEAFLAYFWTRARRRLGQRAGEHFIAITDAGTSLEKLAAERGFRRVFLADPHVGGRYSALSAYGLVPAALMGIDVKQLLARGRWMAAQCDQDLPAARNAGLVLGAVLGEAALQGRDKATFLADRTWSALGSWLEQLIAESSGKAGKGIVPVDGERPGSRKDYPGKDRLFVYLRGDGRLDRRAERLARSGNPLVAVAAQSPYELGAEFYRWEYAVATACSIIGVNAFDQPDVEESKARSAQKVSAYRQNHFLPEGTPVWEGSGARIYGEKFPGLETAGSLQQVLQAFLKQARQGDYVAFNAYLPRNARNVAALARLRLEARRKTGLATMVGFGPRFQHSTGQLHKGGPNEGLFLQITADPGADLVIPGLGLNFGVLERAQALGDLETLQSRGRRVIRLHLTTQSLEDVHI